MLNNIFNKIEEKIKKEENNLPYLFLWNNLEIINSNIKDYSIKLLNDFWIPKEYLFILEDNQEKIKIKDLKEFIKLSDSKPWYPFQIFFIENIYRFTITSANSLLKFFEEPWKHNIIFLSAIWENWILDTILSRTRIINLWWIKKNKNNIFFTDLINDYIKNNSKNIFGYFYKNKLEKDEYINFLDNLIIYYKNNINIWKKILNTKDLIEIDEDINSIKQNNVNAKYIVDKWLLRI